MAVIMPQVTRVGESRSLHAADFTYLSAWSRDGKTLIIDGFRPGGLAARHPGFGDR